MSFDQKEMFYLMYKLTRITEPDTRVEYDALGAVNVPLNRLFGLQTMRSVTKFPIGGIEERMPRSIIIALGILKKASAQINKHMGLDQEICDAILKATDDVISGKLYDEDHFPLAIWQPGAGKSTIINVSEVISNRAIEITSGQVGSKSPVDPQQHVNMSQRNNVSFSSAINIAVAIQLRDQLLPSLNSMAQALEAKENQFKHIIKIGRTHLMDSEPLTLGHVFGGYKQMIINSLSRLDSSMKRLYELPLGGTGTATESTAFALECVKSVSNITNLPFVPATNLFESLSARDSLVEVHGELNCIAVSVMKIVNDISFLGSGPRCGIGELRLPENRPSKLIMGRDPASPATTEVMAMICAQVMGNQVAVTVGGHSGHFELNDFMPMIASNLLRSVTLLSHGLNNLTKNCIVHIQANETAIEESLKESLVLALTLSPYIGEDKAIEVARNAHAKGTTIRQECFKNGISHSDLDSWLKAEDLLGPDYEPK